MQEPILCLDTIPKPFQRFLVFCVVVCYFSYTLCISSENTTPCRPMYIFVYEHQNDRDQLIRIALVVHPAINSLLQTDKLTDDMIKSSNSIFAATMATCLNFIYQVLLSISDIDTLLKFRNIVYETGRIGVLLYFKPRIMNELIGLSRFFHYCQIISFGGVNYIISLHFVHCIQKNIFLFFSCFYP